MMDMKEHSICLWSEIMANCASSPPSIVEKYLEENFIEKTKKLEWVVGRYYKNRAGHKAVCVELSDDNDLPIGFYHYDNSLVYWHRENGTCDFNDDEEELHDEDIVDYWDE